MIVGSAKEEAPLLRRRCGFAFEAGHRRVYIHHRPHTLPVQRNPVNPLRFKRGIDCIIANVWTKLPCSYDGGGEVCVPEVGRVI